MSVSQITSITSARKRRQSNITFVKTSTSNGEEVTVIHAT